MRATNGPRRAAGDASEAPSFDPGDPLAPRRAAPDGDTTAPAGTGDRGPWLVVGIFGLAMAVLVGLLYVVFGTGGGSTPPPVTPSSPAVTQSMQSPSPRPSPSGAIEVVGDTSVTVPAHWELYADEVTEGDRRLIRVRDADAGVLLQVATLTTVGTDLHAACQALITDQGAGYTVDFQVMPTDVTTTGDTEGLVCGFVGTREGESTPTSVLFTMLQRGPDMHTLVLRVMHPRDVAPDSATLAEVTRMSCEAAANFGGGLPLC